MTTVETSLPPWVLALGLAATIALFIFLLRKELRGQPGWIRWSVSLLRIALCALVWWLIAQPRAVTTREEVVPAKLNWGIDVSQSMTLTDPDAGHSAGWVGEAKPGALDEAIALMEAAKIRLNLFAGRSQVSAKQMDESIERTIGILTEARKQVETHGTESGLQRLTSHATAGIDAARTQLKNVDRADPGAAVGLGARMVADIARDLRRIEALREGNPESNSTDVGKSRIERVNAWIEGADDVLKKVSDSAELTASGFSGGLTELEPGEPVELRDGVGMETRLYENLNRLASDRDVRGRQAMLVMTDGVETSGVEQGEFSAELRSQPLIVIPVGDPDRSPDLVLESVTSPSQVREKDKFMAVARVSAANTGPVTVEVTLGDASGILATQEVELPGDGGIEQVELEWLADEPGERQMQVEVTPMDDEKNTGNNLRPLECTVVRDEYRVLVCDALPRWETRYLQNLFNRDPSIRSTVVLFEPRHAYPGKEMPPPPALPLSLESWQQFHLIILGDLNPTQLTPDHQKVLIDYVERGGNLMLIAGRNSMPAAFVGSPLEEILPMVRVGPDDLQGNFVIGPPPNQSLSPMVRISKTDAASVWRDLYTSCPCHRISPWSKAKQSAQSILVARDSVTGQVHDFLAVQRYGRGRVAFAAAPSFHHLRFANGDRYHLRFWGGAVRELSVGDFGFEGGLVKTRLDRRLWESGQEVQGRVRVADSRGVPVEEDEFLAVLTRDGEPVARTNAVPDPARPGDYFLRFPDLEPGTYQLSYEDGEVGDLWEMDRAEATDEAACRFVVLGREVPGEMRHASATPDFWSRVNELPLGATIHPQLLGRVIDAIDLEEETLSIVRSRSIWDTWIVLLAIAGIAGLEWLLRRTHGLC